jgi:hypothetical protein
VHVRNLLVRERRGPRAARAGTPGRAGKAGG